MKAQVIWLGDYITKKLELESEWPWVTLVSFCGDEGMCQVEVVRMNELPFAPDWKPMSIRGYHKCASVPDGCELTLKNPVTMWNYRYPENGAVFLCSTKEERDANLSDA